MVDESGLQRGLADGSLVVDTRIRDALRTLRRPSDGDGLRRFLLPNESDRPLVFGRPEIEDRVAEAVHEETLREAELVRLRRRLDELETRLAGVGR